MATPIADGVPLLGDARVDGLVQGGFWSFGGGPPTLTYSFNTNDTGVGGTWGSYPGIMAAVQQALAEWAKVANLNFVSQGVGGVFNTSTADIAVTLTGDELSATLSALSLGIFPDPDFGNIFRQAAAEAVPPESYPLPEGDIFLDNFQPPFLHMNAGGLGLTVVLHEIGHALGLKHPHDDGLNGRPTYAALGISSQDVRNSTIMSLSALQGGLATGNPATPMPNDILAIQRIYGANMSFNAGNNVYTLTGDGALRTIWDAGGIDTIDASSFDNMTLDLRPGATSSTGFGSIAIAFNVVIENAIGPAGGAIHGNNAGNRLVAGPDEPPFNATTLFGHLGDDTYVINSLNNIIIESPGEGIDGVESSVSHTLQANVENLQLTGSANIDGGGNDLANTIVGNSGRNQISGGTGAANIMRAGAGDDVYVSEVIGDSIIELANEGIDTIRTLVSTLTLPDHVENLTSIGLIGTGDFVGTGNALDNVLVGNQFGNDTLRGLAGNNQLFGESGLDTADYSSAPALVFANLNAGNANNGYGGVDALNSIENLIGSAFADTLIGSVQNNVLLGGTGGDYLLGLDGADRLEGGTGAANTLQGGNQDDLYIVSAVGDSVIEFADEGTDSVETSLNVFNLYMANVENLRFTGSGVFIGIGNTHANTLIGGTSGDTLLGLGGADRLEGGSGTPNTLQGGPGDDLFVVSAIGDSVVEFAAEGTDTVETTLGSFNMYMPNVENLRYTGSATFIGVGNGLDNTLEMGGAGLGSGTLLGLGGNDQLLGGLAAPSTLQGGLGNDTYVVRHAGDSVFELAGEGIDQVDTHLAVYGLPATVENLRQMLFFASSELTGNTLDNVITGGPGNDRIIALGGNNSINGGDFLDSADYSAAPAGVFANLNAGSAANGYGGTDTLTNVEDLIGTAFADTLIGNAQNNVLVGGEGADYLLGLDGYDRLEGGTGAANTLQGGNHDDLYIASAVGDSVIEFANEGMDSVETTLNVFNLYMANVENLRFIGTGSFTGIGNAHNNWMVGGASGDTMLGLDGADRLEGGTGTPNTLQGGPGDDLYIVSTVGDSIVEFAGEGTDTIETSLTIFNMYMPNLEELFYIGGSSFTGIGNGLDNLIVGGDAADLLTGGPGHDILSGFGERDFAIYSGNRAAYTITGTPSNATVSGPEGNDTLLNMEMLIFADLTVSLDSLLAPASFSASFGSSGFILSGSFTTFSMTTAGAATDWRTLATGDYDGNGTEDYLFRNSSGELSVTLLGAGEGAGGALGTVDADAHLVASADFDADGKTDLLWRDDRGALEAWNTDGTSYRLADAGAVPTDWIVRGIADTNADGTDDLTWGAPDGSVELWLMQGFGDAQVAANGVNLGEGNASIADDISAMTLDYDILAVPTEPHLA